TQTVALIAYKRGGAILALLTLLIWILPASALMAAFSFLVVYLDTESIQTNLFVYVNPMSVGFVCYAAVRRMRKQVPNVMTRAIMLGGIVATVLIRSPWIFPVLLLVSGCLTNFSKKRIEPTVKKPKPVRWLNIWLFAAV